MRAGGGCRVKYVLLIARVWCGVTSECDVCETRLGPGCVSSRKCAEVAGRVHVKIESNHDTALMIA